MTRRTLIRSAPALLYLTQTHAASQPADPPAREGSGMANTAIGPRGEVYLSWIDPLPDGVHALRYSRWNGSSWPPAETISQGAGWFVNWADFPALSIRPDGSLLAHWLARPASGGKYGYGIRIARRNPDGHWATTAAINETNVEDYAGFLSFAGSSAVYLAPPTEPKGHQKTLRLAEFAADGTIASSRILDDDVCSCCQTSIVKTPTGLLAAYRDHKPGEIRDISLVRLHDGVWSKPETPNADHWKINGCPTEGPSLAASGQTIAIAWLTRAGNTPKLQFAISPDGGKHFGPAQRIDETNPLGRPHLIASPRGFLLVWIERNAAGAEIRFRTISTKGVVAPSKSLTAVAPSRATGLPRIAVHQNQLILVWRDERVRCRIFDLNA